jgi:hypothetical protein
MLDIKLDGQPYQVPEGWHEVNATTLPLLLQNVYFTSVTPESLHERIRLSIGMTPKAWKKLMRIHFGPGVGKKKQQANAVVLHNLLHLLRWMQTEPIHQQPFRALPEMDFVPELLLPETGFLAMSFGELTDAYIHFLVWLRQLVPGDEHLDLLVATVCRPARDVAELASPTWNGDHREPYNEFAARQRAKALATLEPGYKMAVALFFTGNMRAVLDRYEIFGGEGEPEQYPGQGWIKNQHLLAEKGIFGTVDQTKAANIHDVLLYLEERRKDVLAEIQANKDSEQ